MFFSWLLRKGLVGAISRDLALKYLTIKRQDPCLEEQEIVERVWQLWLSLNEIHIKNERDQDKYIRLEALKQFDTNMPSVSVLLKSRRSLLNVFTDVLYVEAEVNTADGKLYEKALYVFLKETAKLGVGGKPMDLSPRYHDIAVKFAVLMKPFGVESVPQRFLGAAEVAKIISPAIDLARTEFLSICTGNRPGSPLSEALCFPRRFCSGSWKSQDVAESCSKSIQEVFDFGFLVHFAFTEFPTRTGSQMVDPERFRDKWLLESLLAVIKMRDYSAKIVPQVPIESFFTAWYEQAVKNLVKPVWKISLLKRSTVRSYFRATFFTGLALAFEYDLATKPPNKSLKPTPKDGAAEH